MKPISVTLKNQFLALLATAEDINTVKNHPDRKLEHKPISENLSAILSGPRNYMPFYTLLINRYTKK